MIAIQPGALRLLVDMLTQLGQGRAVTVLPQNAELCGRRPEFVFFQPV